MTHFPAPDQTLHAALYISTMPRSGWKGAIVADSVTESGKANRQMNLGYL
jgi:hypothetical protein